MRSIILIGLALMSMAGLAQDTAIVHTYGGNSFEDARCIVPSSLGGYILAGTTGSQQESVTNAYVLKINDELDCVWYLNHGGYGVERLQDVVEDTDGNIIVVGYASVVPDSGYDALVMKLNADGDLIWQRNIGGEGWQFIDEIVLHPLGGYLLAGRLMDGLGSHDALLYHMDSNGNVLSELNFGGAYNDAFNVLAINDSLIVAGGSLGMSDSTECAWSLGLNLNLEVVSADTLFSYENSRWEYMDFHGDTVFTLGTYAIDSLGVRGSFFSRREFGNVVWTLDAYNFEAREIRFKNQMIYLPGTNSFYGLGGAAASICLLNEFGNFIDCPSFGDIGDEGFFAMSFKEGVPLLVGTSNSYSLYNDNDVYAVMLSDSMVYGNYILDIQHEDCFSLGSSQLSLLNQPVIQIFEGSVHATWHDRNISLEIFDVLGNRLDSITQRQQVVLSTSGYVGGIYVMRITSGSEVVNKKIYLSGR